MTPRNSDAPPFLWGVATSGYQSEGGYNGPQQPRNNWFDNELKGRVAPTGQATDFWHRYSEDFARCQQMGLNAFRMGLEWARIQPSFQSGATQPPKFDPVALDAYGDRIVACRQAGLEPIVTLHHFTHPVWLGIDAWLEHQTINAFVQYVTTAVRWINRRLTEVHHLPPIHWYITLNEPNILVSNTYLSGQFPTQTGGIDAAQVALSNLLSAHVQAYNAIHDLYDTEGWPTPKVSLNTYCSDLYWSEKLIWDLLTLRQRKIPPMQRQSYLRESAAHLKQALADAPLTFYPDLPYRLGQIAHWLSHQLGQWLFNLNTFDHFFAALAASKRSQVCDYFGLDYYDPFTAHIFRLPAFNDFEFQPNGLHSWLMSGLTSKWWDWRALPEGLYFFCQYYADCFAPLPLLIAENGMALRRKPDNTIVAPRQDRLRRSDFLKAHVQQVRKLLADGVPLQGYMHWSLTDNYEWGSYTPRFGLFAINFENGTHRLEVDHLGDRPSKTYATLIQQQTKA